MFCFMLLGISVRRAFGTTALMSCSNCSLLIVVAHSWEEVDPTSTCGPPHIFLMVMTGALAGTAAAAASGFGAGVSGLGAAGAGAVDFIGGGAAGLAGSCANPSRDHNKKIAESRGKVRRSMHLGRAGGEDHN